MLREVEAGAEAGDALAFVAREHEVGGELRHVLPGHGEAQVERVGAGGLKGEGVLHAVLYGDVLVVVADERVVVFHGVHEDLQREVLAELGLDGANGLAGEARAVLHALRAVLVFAGVDTPGQHVLHELGGGGVQLDDVEAGRLVACGNLHHGVLQPLEVLNGAGGHVGRSCGELDAGIGALGVDALGEWGELLADGGHVLEQPSTGVAALLVDLDGDELADGRLHEDERSTALGERLVVVEEVRVEHAGLGALIGAPGVRAGWALHDAVAQRERANLERLEKRREIGGAAGEVFHLRVQARCGFGGLCRGDTLSRGYGCSRRGAGAQGGGAYE